MTLCNSFGLVPCGFLCILSLSASRGAYGTQEASPLRLEPSELAYSEMNADMPLWAQEDILSGASGHRYKTLYAGDIVVAIYEATPLKLRINDYPRDEFVTVVSGTLILTADGGSPRHFDVGQSLLVPKGCTGTWELQGTFRELIVMMNRSGGD